MDQSTQGCLTSSADRGVRLKGCAEDVPACQSNLLPAFIQKSRLSLSLLFCLSATAREVQHSAIAPLCPPEISPYQHGHVPKLLASAICQGMNNTTRWLSAESKWGIATSGPKRSTYTLAPTKGNYWSRLQLWKWEGPVCMPCRKKIQHNYWIH